MLSGIPGSEQRSTQRTTARKLHKEAKVSAPCSPITWSIGPLPPARSTGVGSAQVHTMYVSYRHVLSLIPAVALSIFTNTRSVILIHWRLLSSRPSHVGPNPLCLLPFRFLVSVRFLQGIHCYFAAAHVPTGLKAKPLKSSKKQKKTDEADIDLGGAETLIVTRLAKHNVGTLEFFTQFDNLVGSQQPHRLPSQFQPPRPASQASKVRLLKGNAILATLPAGVYYTAVHV
jgi:hypothetical protein